MSVVLIKKDNEKYFMDMMNEDALSVYRSETALAIGNVTDGMTDGVIIGEFLPSGCFQLEWLYVAVAARGKGVAGDLFEALMLALSKTQASCICFDLMRRPENREILSFLQSRGFELETMMEGIAQVKISDLSLLLQEESPDSEEYTEFGKVPSYILKEYIGRTRKDDYAIELYQTNGENAFMEESCVLIKDDKVRDILLAVKEDDEINIVSIEGENKDAILKHFLVKAMPVVGRSCLVTLACGGNLGQRVLKIAGEQESSYEMVVGRLFLA